MSFRRIWSDWTNAPDIAWKDVPTVLLKGGISRLQMQFRGWGRLDVEYREATGTVHSCRRYCFGSPRDFFLDIRPTGSLRVTAKNAFGQSELRLTVAAKISTPKPVDMPELASIPIPPRPIDGPVTNVRAPQVRQRETIIGLPTPVLPTPFTLRLPEIPNSGWYMEQNNDKR